MLVNIFAEHFKSESHASPFKKYIVEASCHRFKIIYGQDLCSREELTFRHKWVPDVLGFLCLMS